MNAIIPKYMFLNIWLLIKVPENKGLVGVPFPSKLLTSSSALLFATRGLQ